jgi:hypothetical protein
VADLGGCHDAVMGDQQNPFVSLVDGVRRLGSVSHCGVDALDAGGVRVGDLESILHTSGRRIENGEDAFSSTSRDGPFSHNCDIVRFGTCRNAAFQLSGDRVDHGNRITGRARYEQSTAGGNDMRWSEDPSLDPEYIAIWVNDGYRPLTHRRDEQVFRFNYGMNRVAADGDLTQRVPFIIEQREDVGPFTGNRK